MASTERHRFAHTEPRDTEWWRAGDAREPDSVVEDVGTAGRDQPLAFWCVVFFMFILLVAPQNVYPVLAPLRLAFVSATLALAVYLLDRLGSGAPLLSPHPEYRILGVFIGLALFSVPFSMWPGGSLATITGPFARSLVFFFLLGELLSTPRRLDLFLRTALLSGTVLAWIGIAAMDSANLAEGYRLRGGWSGIAGNPNDFALILNLLIPFALARTHRGWSWTDRLLALTYLGSALFGLLLTFSRAGMITLPILLAVWVWQSRARVSLARVVLLAGIVTFSAVAVAPEGWSERIASITDFSKDRTGSAEVRRRGMTHALNVMLERPVTGVGIGMNVLALNEKEESWKAVHNVYLEIGSETGLPGLAVFLLLLVRLFRTAAASSRLALGDPDPRPYLLVAAATTSLIAFCVAGMFHPVAYQFHFYLSAGLTVAAAAAVRAGRRDVASPDPKVRTAEDHGRKTLPHR